MSNNFTVNHRKWIVFCAFCITLCGSYITEVYTNEVLTDGTTGLEDIFSEAKKYSLAIKNIAIEVDHNDEYYLSWFFDNGNNNDIEATIDVHVINEGTFDFFRHLEKLHKSDFQKLNIGKLEKSRTYYATLQAHNKLGETEKYHFDFETSLHNIDKIQQNISSDKTRSGPVGVINLTNNTNQLKNDQTVKCVPDSVQAFEVDGVTTETTIPLKWVAPADLTSCPTTGYQLKIHHGAGLTETTDLPTTETSYEYSALFPCKKYTISISTVAVGDIGRATSLTPDPETQSLTDLRPVNLRPFVESVANDLINVEWFPSVEEKECIQGYIVTVKVNDVGDPLQLSTATTHKIQPVNGCSKYTVSVEAVSKTGKPSLSADREIQTSEKIPGKVQNLVVDSDPTSIKVTWEAPLDNPNCVNGYQVKIDGGAPVDSDSTFSHTFTNLDSCKEYTIQVVAKSSTGEGPSKQTKSKTASPAKLSPVDPPHVDETTQAGSIIVTWTPLPREKQCIEQYNIEVDGKPVNNAADPLDTTHVITGVLACQTYNVSVTATAPSTSIAASDPRIRSIVAKGEPPGAPDLTLASNPELQPNSVNLIVTINPDNNNACKVKKVRVKCKEMPSDIVWLSGSVEDQDFDVPEDLSVFPIEFVGLLPFTTYKCYGTSFTEGALESDKSTPIDAKTDNRPAKPEIENIIIAEKNSLQIKWKANNPDGVKYSISVTPIESMHYIPTDCNDAPEPIDPVPDATSPHKVEGLLPSYKYEVSVIAIYSEISSDALVIEGITLEDASGYIRELNNKVLQGDIASEEYDFRAFLTWKYPCNTNGIVSKFIIGGHKISIEPVGTQIPIQEINIDIDPATPATDYSYELPLDIYHSYELEIKIVTTSTQTSLIVGKTDPFTSPNEAPTPPAPGEVSITPPDSGSFISFVSSAFTAKNKDIKYFAILLSANYEFDKDSGYFNGWPDVGSYSAGTQRVIEPYQITPEKWAPPKTLQKNDEVVVTYQLGNQECTDNQKLCNGAMRADTEYTVTVRALTTTGYTDLRLKFDTPTLNKAVSLGLILGITFGVIFTGLIFLGSYLIYRKRMFRSRKKLNRNSGIHSMHPTNARMSDRYNMYN